MYIHIQKIIACRINLPHILKRQCHSYMYMYIHTCINMHICICIFIFNMYIHIQYVYIYSYSICIFIFNMYILKRQCPNTFYCVKALQRVLLRMYACIRRQSSLSDTHAHPTRADAWPVSLDSVKSWKSSSCTSGGPVMAVYMGQ